MAGARKIQGLNKITPAERVAEMLKELTKFSWLRRALSTR